MDLFFVPHRLEDARNSASSLLYREFQDAKMVGRFEGMETFVLIAFIWVGGGTGFQKVRTPDLLELQCRLMAMQIDRVRPGHRAWCEIQGRPEPVWSKSP